MNQEEQLVSVRVVAYRKTAEAPVQLAVDPEVLNLNAIAKGPVRIQWLLDTKGYKFPDDGTAIEFTSPGAERSFGKVEVPRGGRVAITQGTNADGLAYAYNVKVIDESTGKATVLDPVVQNQMN